MPLFDSHSIADFPIGLTLLSEQTFPESWQRHPLAWIHPTEWAEALSNKCNQLVDAQNRQLVWHPKAASTPVPYVCQSSLLIEYPWQLLDAHEAAMALLHESSIRGEIHASSVISGPLVLGKGSQILPGVVIDGPVIIGDHCKIGPNAYLRGATRIGSNCIIGQAVEVKNSIILDHSSLAHLSYVGDSIVGSHVNLGGGTITSNWRHDGKPHRRPVNGIWVDTGRTKLGALIGDHVKTGIHTAIYPARQLNAHTHTKPGQVVDKDL